MKPDGRQEVLDALQDASLEFCDVTPAPDKGGDYRYITIRTPAYTTPADVLNALADNALMHTSLAESALEKYPEAQPFGVLVPVASHLGSLTLEDVTYLGHQRS
jgi:hypothetical protein